MPARTYEGKPCPHCGSGLRYKSSRGLVCAGHTSTPCGEVLRRSNERRRAARRDYQRQYRRTARGKAARREAQRRYRQTARGKAMRREADRRYRQTEGGKAARREAKRRHRARKRAAAS
jgi:hypothetical protein